MCNFEINIIKIEICPAIINENISDENYNLATFCWFNN